jgi:two-component system, NarL family, response regulator LiaR
MTVPAPSRTHALRGRELEILKLIAEGKTNRQIADDCYLSINSIKTYIRSAYRKLGVSTRSEAVLWAAHNGLVDVAPVGRGSLPD